MDRYHLDGRNNWWETSHGEWVKYKDVKAKDAEIAELKAYINNNQVFCKDGECKRGADKLEEKHES